MTFCMCSHILSCCCTISSITMVFCKPVSVLYCDSKLLTQQEQFHFSGRFLSIFSQVFINHFRPLGRGFVFLTDCTTHGSQCALQDCCLVGKYYLGKNYCRARNPLFKNKGWSWVRWLPFFDEWRQTWRGPFIRERGRISSENRHTQTISFRGWSQLGISTLKKFLKTGWLFSHCASIGFFFWTWRSCPAAGKKQLFK